MRVQFSPGTHQLDFVELQRKNIMKWYVYIVKCKDESLYTGITTDLQRRIAEHNNDDTKGAKSLRGRRPVGLVYSEEFQTESDAKKREEAIKGWRRKYKLLLIKKGL